LTITDQHGTVRTMYYDKLGRLTNDCVSTNGTGTDVTVKQPEIKVPRTFILACRAVRRTRE